MWENTKLCFVASQICKESALFLSLFWQPSSLALYQLGIAKAGFLFQYWESMHILTQSVLGLQFRPPTNSRGFIPQEAFAFMVLLMDLPLLISTPSLCLADSDYTKNSVLFKVCTYFCICNLIFNEYSICLLISSCSNIYLLDLLL